MNELIMYERLEDKKKLWDGSLDQTFNEFLTEKDNTGYALVTITEDFTMGEMDKLTEYLVKKFTLSVLKVDYETEATNGEKTGFKMKFVNEKEMKEAFQIINFNTYRKNDDKPVRVSFTDGW